MRRHLAAFLLAAVTILSAHYQRASAGDRWCIVDPQHYETVYRDILAEVQFLEEECVWSEELGPYSGIVFAYCDEEWEYHQMHYYRHACVQPGHTQYFDSAEATLRQLESYKYTEETR